MAKKYYLIFLLFIFIFEGTINSIIVLPFAVSEPSEDEVKTYYTTNDYFLEHIQIDFYSSLHITQKDFRILARISADNNTFSLSEEECKRESLKYAQHYDIMTRNTYRLHQSLSYKNISKFNNSLTNYKEGGIISEELLYYNTTKLKCQPSSYGMYDKDIDSQIKINEMNIIIEDFTASNLCAMVGLGKPDSNTKEAIHFINELKIIKAINDYSFTYKFITSTSGQLIIGGLPHDYYNNSKIQQSQYFKINTYEPNNNQLPWSVLFNKIFIEKTDNNTNMKADVQNNAKSYIVPNLGFIIGTTQYKKLIMEKYFNALIKDGICQLEKINNINFNLYDLKNNNYEIFTCDSYKIESAHKVSFPYLKFNQNNYNYIFFFSFYNLFVELKEKYYFNVIFPEETYLNNNWYLGLPFLRRYQFIFNYDSKTIGFYNENYKGKSEGNSETNTESNSSSYFKIIIQIIIVIVLVILIFVAFIIGRKYNDNRKKRANELDDNYEYLTKQNNEEQNEEKENQFGINNS
jgi:hypothetical protein